MVRVLHVDGYGVRIGARKGNLLVRDEGGSRVVPLGDVDVVVVATSGVSISSSALRLMARYGVELVVLDSRGDPVGMYYLSYYTRTPFTRRAQYQSLLDGRGVSVACELARSKIYNQACHVREMSGLARSRRREYLGQLLQAVRELGSIEESYEAVEEARREIIAVEARAASTYWAAMAEHLPGDVGFRGRDRGSGDAFNSSLNYGYGILYSLAWRSLVLAGLDPYAGFLHVDRSGKPVLAFDYVEMFRVHVVDKPLASEFRRGYRPRVSGGRLEPADRRKIASLLVSALSRVVEGERLDAAVRRYALRLARSLRSGSPFRGFRGCKLELG